MSRDWIKEAGTLPNYGLSEASRYLHIPMRTLRRWTGTEGTSNGVIRITRTPPYLLSFEDLVELYILEQIRQTYGVDFSQIRRAMAELRKQFPQKPRLAHHDVSTDGRYVYISSGRHLINLSVQGQLAMRPVLERFLKRIERDEDRVARKLYPYMRKPQLHDTKEYPRIVEINPDIQFGIPVLVGSRITTEHLLARKIGGDSIESMARDYGRSAKEIEEAIRWEEGRAA